MAYHLERTHKMETLQAINGCTMATNVDGSLKKDAQGNQLFDIDQVSYDLHVTDKNNKKKDDDKNRIKSFREKMISDSAVSYISNVTNSDIPDTLSSPAYNPTTGTYIVGEYITESTIIYRCITEITVSEVFDPTKWSTTTPITFLFRIKDRPNFTSRGIKAKAFNESFSWYPGGKKIIVDSNLFQDIYDNLFNNDQLIHEAYLADKIGIEAHDYTVSDYTFPNLTPFGFS